MKRASHRDEEPAPRTRPVREADGLTPRTRPVHEVNPDQVTSQVTLKVLVGLTFSRWSVSAGRTTR